MNNKIINVCFGSSDMGMLQRYLFEYFRNKSNDPFWRDYKNRSSDDRLSKLQETFLKTKELGIGEFITLEFDLNVGTISGDFRAGRFDVERMMYEPFGVESDKIAQIVDNKLKLLKKVKDFAEKGHTIRIWTTNENFSQCGLAFLLSELKDIDADVEIAKVLVDDWRKADILEIMDADFKTIKITQNEKEEFAKIWKIVKSEDTGLRMLSNGKIVNVPVTFYDKNILNFVSERKGKVRSRTIEGHILGKSEQYIQCYFVNERINILIKEGNLEFKGFVRGSCCDTEKYVSLKEGIK